MSQYNKTVLTHAGLELAKRANAGQAKFGITRAVTSADDWSNKTVQDLEEVTTIPNIMQQGTIMDTDEVESNNSVISVSLCFTNKNLSTGYQIRIIGLYVKEEGQENDFLYAVTTAITPEYMPSFADKVLYKFNMQMYLVIGNAQAVNVVINEGTAVTSTQFNKYKDEVADNLKKLENTHKEDMSHVAKSASINGGAEILPDSTGKLNLVVPDPDLSEYVSLEQLTEILQAKADVADVNKQIKAVTDLANTKANSADVYTKTETNNQINKFDLSKVKFRKQYLNGDGQAVDKTWSATKNDDGTYTIDLYNDDWAASKLHDVLEQLPSKANASDVYTKSDVDSALAVDRGRLGKLEGTQTLDSPDFNSITSTGVYYITNNTPANIKNNPSSQWGVLVVSNGNGNRTSQVYYPDDGSPQWCRLLNESNWLPWYQLSTKKDISNAINKFDLSKVKFRKQYLNGDGQAVDKTWSATKNDDGTYTIDLYNDDWTASKLHDVLEQLPSKANASDVYTKSDVDSALAVDRGRLGKLEGTQTLDSPDFNSITSTGVYYITNNTPANIKNNPVAQRGVLVVSNGAGHRTSQMYFPGDGSALYMRELDETTWHDWIQLATTSQVNVDGPLFKHLTQFNNWSDLFDDYSVNGITATNGKRLVAFRDDTNGGNTVGSNSAGIAFGGSDTKGVLSVQYNDHQARIAGGNGDAPVWHEDIAWKSDITELQNQIQQLRDNQFEVQTFTDANVAANWEAQRPGKRMAIVNS